MEQCQKLLAVHYSVHKKKSANQYKILLILSLETVSYSCPSNSGTKKAPNRRPQVLETSLYMVYTEEAT